MDKDVHASNNLYTDQKSIIQLLHIRVWQSKQLDGIKKNWDNGIETAEQILH